MPQTSEEDLTIRRVWQPRRDSRHIHYLTVGAACSVHLRADVRDPLYPLLAEVLDHAERGRGGEGTSPPNHATR